MVLTARSLRVDADLGCLADVRGFIRRAAAEAEAPVSCLEDLVQAIDEAATNAIVHGYDGAPGWLEVSAEMDGPIFVIRLEDAAREFDPTAVPEPDLSVPPMARKPGVNASPAWPSPAPRRPSRRGGRGSRARRRGPRAESRSRGA